MSNQGEITFYVVRKLTMDRDQSKTMLLHVDPVRCSVDVTFGQPKSKISERGSCSCGQCQKGEACTFQELRKEVDAEYQSLPCRKKAKTNEIEERAS